MNTSKGLADFLVASNPCPDRLKRIHDLGTELLSYTVMLDFAKRKTKLVGGVHYEGGADGMEKHIPALEELVASKEGELNISKSGLVAVFSDGSFFPDLWEYDVGEMGNGKDGKDDGQDGRDSEATDKDGKAGKDDGKGEKDEQGDGKDGKDDGQDRPDSKDTDNDGKAGKDDGKGEKDEHGDGKDGKYDGQDRPDSEDTDEAKAGVTEVPKAAKVSRFKWTKAYELKLIRAYNAVGTKFNAMSKSEMFGKACNRQLSDKWCYMVKVLDYPKEEGGVFYELIDVAAKKWSEWRFNGDESATVDTVKKALKSYQGSG